LDHLALKKEREKTNLKLAPNMSSNSQFHPKQNILSIISSIFLVGTFVSVCGKKK
jgi:hypothetical protein